MSRKNFNSEGVFQGPETKKSHFRKLLSEKNQNKILGKVDSQCLINMKIVSTQFEKIQNMHFDLFKKPRFLQSNFIKYSESIQSEINYINNNFETIITYFNENISKLEKNYNFLLEFLCYQLFYLQYAKLENTPFNEIILRVFNGAIDSLLNFHTQTGGELSYWFNCFNYSTCRLPADMIDTIKDKLVKSYADFKANSNRAKGHELKICSDLKIDLTAISAIPLMSGNFTPSDIARFSPILSSRFYQLKTDLESSSSLIKQIPLMLKLLITVEDLMYLTEYNVAYETLTYLEESVLKQSNLLSLSTPLPAHRHRHYYTQLFIIEILTKHRHILCFQRMAYHWIIKGNYPTLGLIKNLRDCISVLSKSPEEIRIMQSFLRCNSFPGILKDHLLSLLDNILLNYYPLNQLVYYMGIYLINKIASSASLKTENLPNLSELSKAIPGLLELNTGKEYTQAEILQINENIEKAFEDHSKNPIWDQKIASDPKSEKSAKKKKQVRGKLKNKNSQLVVMHSQTPKKNTVKNVFTKTNISYVYMHNTLYNITSALPGDENWTVVSYSKNRSLPIEDKFSGALMEFDKSSTKLLPLEYESRHTRFTYSTFPSQQSLVKPGEHITLLPPIEITLSIPVLPTYDWLPLTNINLILNSYLEKYFTPETLPFFIREFMVNIQKFCILHEIDRPFLRGNFVRTLLLNYFNPDNKLTCNRYNFVISEPKNEKKAALFRQIELWGFHPRKQNLYYLVNRHNNRRIIMNLGIQSNDSTLYPDFLPNSIKFLFQMKNNKKLTSVSLTYHETLFKSENDVSNTFISRNLTIHQSESVHFHQKNYRYLLRAVSLHILEGWNLDFIKTGLKSSGKYLDLMTPNLSLSKQHKTLENIIFELKNFYFALSDSKSQRMTESRLIDSYSELKWLTKLFNGLGDHKGNHTRPFKNNEISVVLKNALFSNNNIDFLLLFQLYQIGCGGVNKTQTSIYIQNMSRLCNDLFNLIMMIKLSFEYKLLLPDYNLITSYLDEKNSELNNRCFKSAWKGSENNLNIIVSRRIEEDPLKIFDIFYGMGLLKKLFPDSDNFCRNYFKYPDSINQNFISFYSKVSLNKRLDAMLVIFLLGEILLSSLNYRWLVGSNNFDTLRQGLSTIKNSRYEFLIKSFSNTYIRKLVEFTKIIINDAIRRYNPNNPHVSNLVILGFFKDAKEIVIEASERRDTFTIRVF